MFHIVDVEYYEENNIPHGDVEMSLYKAFIQYNVLIVDRQVDNTVSNVLKIVHICLYADSYKT